MEPEPPSIFLHAFDLSFVLLSGGVICSIILLLLLIICSALISGSEVAFFSISPQDTQDLQEEETVSSDRILSLREKPRTLLATILIANNLINIAIVIISSYVFKAFLGVEALEQMGQYVIDLTGVDSMSATTIGEGINFLITVIGVTFLLLLFGEVLPKIYANLNNLSFARQMALPLGILNVLFGPLSKILVRGTNSLEHRMVRNKSSLSSTSKEDLDKAIELTANQGTTSDQEVDILKGIIKFGDVSAKQIMKSRVDVVAVEDTISFDELLNVVKESGYSRIPVYKEDFDNIIGLLYVKDLLGRTKDDVDFGWQKLIRDNVLYIPEAKKIDALLREFQKQRLHIAIVVDEYGGSAGIVTLEDVMEEVIGDIKDEFDEQHSEVEFIKINDHSYIFEGKTMINDFCRIIGEDSSIFDSVRGDADSVAGLVLELVGFIPKLDKEVSFEKYKFKVVSVSNKRVEKIHVTMPKS